MSSDLVSRLWTRYQETRQYTRRQIQCRLRMTTPRQDRYLVVLTHRKSTSRSLDIDFRHATQVHSCNQTVRNRLHEDGLRVRRPATGPILTAQHRTARLDFVREYQNWQLRHWRLVIFTNESRFSVSTNDRRVRGWRCQESVMRTVTLWKLTGMVEVQSWFGPE